MEYSQIYFQGEIQKGNIQNINFVEPFQIKGSPFDIVVKIGIDFRNSFKLGNTYQSVINLDENKFLNKK